MLLTFWLILVFVTGASVGSFLNVAIARLPLEKSLLWPNSRCGSCWQPIRWFDNLPLLSYLWLRGRCRTCGQSYSIAYFLVELGTALGFVGLFWLEVVENVHGWPGHDVWGARFGKFPTASWIGFGWHALLFSFLVVASVCDLKTREIPLQLTLTGTLVGLAGSALLPWPFPQPIPAVPIAPMSPLATIPQGVYPWPFWLPLPAWFGPGGNWETGLATGLLGALAGTFLLRATGFLFSTGLGKEALGLGDADLMMLAGAFLGWQGVVVAFFVSVVPALLFGVVQWVVHNDNSLPFGPSLSVGIMVTCLAWQPIGNMIRPAFFWAELLGAAVVACGLMLLFLAFMFRLLRQPEEPAK
jgi:leader peptidase (prepilin peptidase)/N-methyltransferase